MLEYIEKGLKHDYKFTLEQEGLKVEVKKNLPFCSFKPLYSSSYADCEDIKVNCGLLSNSMTVHFQEISFSHGDDARKILCLIKLGQVDPVMLAKFIPSHNVSLDSINFKVLKNLFDSRSLKRGSLSELVYKLLDKQHNKKASNASASERSSYSDEEISQDKVLTLDDSLTSIDSRNLDDYKGIEVVVLPRNLENIDEDTFKDHRHIKEIDFSKVTRLKEIPSYLFSKLDDITTLVIPEGVTRIGDQAFYKCKNLTKIVFPSTIEEIECVFIEDCNNLSEIDMSKVHLLKEIPENFFCYLDNLSSFVIPEGVTKIEGKAFHHCKNLTKIVFPSTVEDIECVFIEECRNLFEIDMSKVHLLKEIPENFLSFLDYLSSFVIPEGVTKIESKAFCHCKNLTKIVIPSTVEEIEGGFIEECRNLSEIDMSKAHLLKEIDDNFLGSNNRVKEFIIPEGVTSVGTYFIGSNVETLYVPSTVKEIGDPCRDTCDIKVYLYADAVEDVSSLCEADITLYVHNSAYGYYKGLFDEIDKEEEVNAKLKSFPDDAPYVSKDYERKTAERKVLSENIVQQKQYDESTNNPLGDKPIEENGQDLTQNATSLHDDISAKLKAQEFEEKSHVIGEIISALLVKKAAESLLKVFIIADGKQEGPFNDEQFARLVEYGLVNSDTLVWQEGMAQWQKAGSVGELQHFFNTNEGGSTPPPVPIS